MVLHESRTVYHVGFVLRQRLHKTRNVPRVVFQIGVLHHDVAASRHRESASQCGTLALVGLLKRHTQFGELLVKRCEHRTSRVCTAVVNDDDLHGKRQCKETRNHAVDGSLFVVDGNHDAQTKARRQFVAQLARREIIATQFFSNRLVQLVKLIECRVGSSNRLLVVWSFDRCFHRGDGGIPRTRSFRACRCRGVRNFFFIFAVYFSSHRSLGLGSICGC